MVFNAIFNNINFSFIGGGNQIKQRKPPTCRKSLTNFILYYCIEYTLPEWDSNS
jgi:hypothetical protein